MIRIHHALLLLVFLSPFSHAWDLEKDENGIKVYTKDIPNSSFKAFRGETTIAAPLLQIISHHLDVESMSEWLQDCSVSELVDKVNDQEFYVYQRTNAPWPVTDRDYVMHATLTQDKDTYAVTMDFVAAPDTEKHNDECVQVTQLKGFWRFSPIKENQVFVEYETHADPAGAIPSWLANSFVVDQPFNTLKNLKQRVIQQPVQEVSGIEFIKRPEFEENSKVSN